jgi:integrase
MTEEEQPQEEKKPPERKKRKRGRRVHGTGSVFQRLDRKGKQWVAQVVLEHGKTRQRYFWTQVEAADALNEMLYEQKRGMLVKEKDQTVQQLIEHWLENVHKKTIRLSSYAEYRSVTNTHILPELGYIKLQQLTIQRVERFYMRKQDDGLSASRIRAIHRVLHQALAYAVRTNLVMRNVCDAVKLPRLTRRERQPLTLEQAQKLLAVAKGHQLEALLTTALVTGMREGELLALRWNDINFEQQYLQVRRTVRRIAGQGLKEGEPKSESSRRKIVLSPFLLGVLKQHRVRQLEAKLKAGPVWEEHDLVFCNNRGKFMDNPDLLKRFDRLLKAADLPHMHFHDLRHSAATFLLAMGVHAKIAQELLGHSNIAITLNIYSHVLPSLQKDAVDKLSSLFDQQEDQEDDVQKN